MDEDAKNLFAVAGAMVLIPAIIVGASIWSGYTLALAWGWIMVPTFGLAALTIPQAIGVTMIVGHLAKYIPGDDKKADWAKLFGRLVAGPALFLLGTYIVSLFL